MVIFCKTKVQYNNQEVDIEIIYYSDFSSFTCTQVCVCVNLDLCTCITRVGSGIRHLSLDREQFHPHKDPLCYFVTTTPFSSCPTSLDHTQTLATTGVVSKLPSFQTFFL